MPEKIGPIDGELAGKRARDSDREAVMSLLDAAFAEGQLDGAEHRERVARVVNAATLGELSAPLQDLQVAPPAFMTPPVVVPPAPSAPLLPAKPPAPPHPAGEAGTVGEHTGPDPTRWVAGGLGAFVIITLFVIVVAVVSSQSSTSTPATPTFPGLGEPGYTICDVAGENCKDGHGNRVPDMPRERTAVPGPTVVGNPMASTNIRKVYESVVSALKPQRIIELTINESATSVTVVQSEDPTRSRLWALNDGSWRSNTRTDSEVDGASGFTPSAMNLDAITTSIADAPGIERIAREPETVTFAPNAVTIVYAGPNRTTPRLILAPDGTVVP